MDILNNKSLVDYINKVNEMNYVDRSVFLHKTPDIFIDQILRDYYGYSHVILEDKELLKLIEGHRVGDIPRSGINDLDIIEVGYLMKAWKSQQYHGFMCHILNRYMNDDKNKLPHAVISDDRLECCVCWRGLHGLPMNKKHEAYMFDDDLAYTSFSTGTCICRNCLYQLFMFSQLMNLLKDKDFYNLINR